MAILRLVALGVKLRLLIERAWESNLPGSFFFEKTSKIRIPNWCYKPELVLQARIGATSKTPGAESLGDFALVMWRLFVR